VTVSSSSLLQNTADHRGGALYNLSGWMTVEDGSTVEDNQAGKSGGAIYTEVGNLEVNGSSLFHNTAQENGGGIDSISPAVVRRFEARFGTEGTKWVTSANE
jgi:predicted outer membrane repeat protein